MKKYQVIGGQYEQHFYGESDSLRGAKCIATRNAEYWDNWQGWHVPQIFDANDVQVVTARGWITVNDGEEVRVTKPDAQSVAYHDGKRWIER